MIYALYDIIKSEGKEVECPYCAHIVNPDYLTAVFNEYNTDRFRNYCVVCKRPITILKSSAEHIGTRRKGKGVCSGCGEVDTPLVEHHWWIKGLPIARETKCTAMVCRRCNHIPALTGTYIQSKWASQLRLINAYYAEEKEMGREDDWEESLPCMCLSPLPSDLSLRITPSPAQPTSYTLRSLYPPINALSPISSK